MSRIPLQTRLPKTCRILHIQKETEDVQTFTFDVSLGALPGQFVMLWIPGVDEKPFSIAGDDGKSLKVTFFAVGPMSTALSKMKVGELVGVRGPFGTNYEWEPKQKLALLAGGYGAAPMYFVANEAVKDDAEIDVIVGARSKKHLLYLSELSSLSNTTLHVATDDGSEGEKGYNVQVIKSLLDQGKSFDQIFACGPEMMLKAVLDVSKASGIPCQLSLERYMKCGYGLCGNCTVDPLGIRLCKEGPVVKGEVCEQITEFGKYHRDSVGRKHEF
ncbi:dihydroorotate dehydrogenase electron transfer subunit [Candidatus Peregrinibacteria bacterium]|nr:dihydroorotate dehydrogenase electron transfer subunit [Candidatus Peregrinibacteria bacterium]MBT3598853.1 dihydroorotate dehydrogenase electron transfer subunit [Candidatus Peregrinibacteria bacterium]MBT4366874.1 dihydroorotate dehydrogenase electron transfer subunit [Candidatus Peregrinibacteria bacterium]MBT4586169.1 dihydroorotate dehydrogenase electron transfer subunit [Candidatus Peregrinibacteria bacterium]MBT6730809.1 dihydroorotate dehydrogenase electron transfer subunit [Candidat